MSNRIQRIKNHLIENQTVYIVGASCLVVGAAGAAVVLHSPTDMNVSNKIQQILSWKPTATLEVYIEALGDPGNIIQDTTTGTIYASQGQAARELGLKAPAISKHLNGHTPHVQGHIFEKLGKALVSQ